MNESSDSEAATELRQFLIAHNLLATDDTLRCTALRGGVSSDIWRVDTPERSLCVKRALPALRVTAQWEVPVSRNANEWAWLCFAARHEPDAVPTPLAHDPAAGYFAMSYLPAEQYPVWKELLMQGRIDSATAVKVGRVVAALHNASANDQGLASEFDTLETFTAIRLAPYFLETARRHPKLASRLKELAYITAGKKLALVHGDISPKNILVGSRGPVLLDAECAWYGDPAFDLAFCLTHLLLKGVRYPHRLNAYLADFEALSSSYLANIRFEAEVDIDARAARLLAALVLARIDGKSPVEYLVGREAQRQWVRDMASPLIERTPSSVSDFADTWAAHAAQLEGLAVDLENISS